MPGEITAEHLKKEALIYVRQSSRHQVRHNLESQEVQYKLEHRARALGWPANQIVILDHDLGLSATGVKKRRDFEDLMRRVGAARAGAIFVFNSSRMARNGREWHQVLELCPVCNTLIIDSDGVYDPRLPSDRLWLGMKASFSEYEVHQLQALARAARWNKAERGQLFMNLPAGFIATEEDRIELDPNQRIQQILRTLFAKFEEFGSIRQVYKWCHREGLEIPVRHYDHGVSLAWRLPAYSTLNLIFTNPLYAGIYQYPKTITRTRVVEGRIVKTRGHRVTAADNPILLPNLFEGYISREQFERNQKIITQNAQRRSPMVTGAAREGASLLAGLIKCGHCTRKMHVHYAAGVPVYVCPSYLRTAQNKSCLRWRGRLLEQYLSAQILAAVEPLALEAACLAEEKRQHATQQKADAVSHALAQAQYEAQRFERQFNATEPENLLVSRTLVARWQKALEKVETLQSQYEQARAHDAPLAEAERARLLTLAKDLKSVWEHPATNNQLKTRLVRVLVKEIWVKALDAKRLHATIHWQGGVHTEFEFPRGRSTPQPELVKEQEDVVELIRKLALICADQHITRILNRAKIPHANQQSWSEFEVTALREKHQIAAFSPEQYEARGLVNLKQAAKRLGASLGLVLKLIHCGLIHAQQILKHAPWEIARAELDKPIVRRAIAALQKGQEIPFHESQQQLNLS
jgi:DNA invertase Pin-like site-specific DNA recombinase